MCGRYSVLSAPEALGRRFDATVAAEYEPRYNAAPGQLLPVVTADDPGAISLKQWGLVPSWADDEFEGLPDARAETVAENPSFREAYERRRCLVPADGFYEWPSIDGRTQPVRVTLPGGELFAMAGIHERWKPDTTRAGLSDFPGGPATPGAHDVAVETFAVVTTEPNGFVAGLHDRMPVILSPGEEAAWLRDPTPELLDPYDGDLRAYPVSTLVNDPSNDSPDVIEPVPVPDAGVGVPLEADAPSPDDARPGADVDPR
jgi:putative SOS response-associated peptidase YedK